MHIVLHQPAMPKIPKGMAKLSWQRSRSIDNNGTAAAAAAAVANDDEDRQQDGGWPGQVVSERASAALTAMA